MRITISKLSTPGAATLSPEQHSRLRSWLFSWEIYLIVLVASLLRFYQINTTQFMEDQAAVFSLAHHAIAHRLIPITSNAASVGIANPPGVIYFLMLPALLSPDPVWGAVQVGIFTVVAALLTYLFTRRYYGRFAGIVAALLYATASKPLEYARAIWQQNLMAPFLVLFMFALFWGVVERRKGWFAPAILLLGILFQLHESSSLLVIPLLLAVVLAPKTLRWRDLGLAVAALFIIYFPWIIWEVHTKFADILSLFSLSKQHTHIDSQAIRFYLLFLSPYNPQLVSTHSLLGVLAPWLSWLEYVLPALVVGGFVTILGLALHGETRLRNWWAAFCADPYKCGLIVLLAWQIVPLVLLSRHAIDLQPHYFLFLMPGPFILIGLFLSKLVGWSQQRGNRWKILRYGVYIITGLIIMAQLVGSTASVIDISNGHFDDRSFYSHYRSDLNSLQRALTEADQLAQQRHLDHVYITTDSSTAPALRYLSEQIQTPTTLFDTTNCLVLPNPTDGPAVLLVGPYDPLTNALLSEYATATLVDQPLRPGGAPFKLYVITPISVQTSTTATFTNNLQLLSVQAHHFSFDSSSWLVTRWSILRSAQPGLRTTYNYAFTGLSAASNKQNAFCTFTTMRPGDQLLVAFSLPNNTLMPSSVTFMAQASMKTPYNPSYGPFHFETYIDQTTPAKTLQTPEGKDSITYP